MSTKESKLGLVAQQAFSSKKSLLLRNAQLEAEIAFTSDKIKTLQDLLEAANATIADLKASSAERVKDINDASAGKVEKLKATIDAKSAIITRLEGNRETLRERNAKLTEAVDTWREKYQQAINASETTQDE